MANLVDLGVTGPTVIPAVGGLNVPFGRLGEGSAGGYPRY